MLIDHLSSGMPCLRLVALTALTLQGIVAALPVPIVSQAQACSASVGSGLLYRCASAPIDQRADDLLAQLSVDEIIQQTWSPYSAKGNQVLPRIGNNGVGQLSYGAAAGNSVIARVAARNAIQKQIMDMSTHRIPASWSAEALHSATRGGTVFPELVTQGATWDPDLIEEINAAIAREATSVGVDTAFAPVLNMWVDSRFGRLQEGYTENPTLTAAYAIAAVKGLQGEQAAGVWSYFNSSKLVALGKHFAAYGAALGGLNGAPAEMSERTLREWYLAPWRAFAAAGGKAVMASHNTVLNQPMHANDYVTNTILRKEFGFGEGFVISDCNDVDALVSFRVAANLSHAAGKGINGGVDIDLQCGPQSAYTHLAVALQEGSTTLDKIKRAAGRVLQAKFALGLFEKPMTDPSGAEAALNTKEHQQLALRAAEEGVVMLQNQRSFLPLSSSVKRVAVVGANGGCEDSSKSRCDGRLQLLGSYTQYDGSVHVPTVAEALAEATQGHAEVSWSFGASAKSQPADVAAAARAAAVTLASNSDVVVAVLGDDTKSSSEWGDRDNLDLPGDQLQLLHAVVATGKPVVLVLVTGRTATFGPGNSVLQNVTAIFSAFRPGQMGGVAIANLITGKANPTGKLAQNWVRSVGQVMSGASPWLQWRVGKWVANQRSKADPDGRMYDNYNDGPSNPLFHFGYGLSYSTYSISNLKVSPTGSGQNPVLVEVTVSNSGKMDGAEVVQIYAIDPVMEYVRPWKRLLAFKRVAIAAGASKSVQVNITADQMAFQDDSSSAGAWRVVPGQYQIRVGSCSLSDTLTATITLGGGSDGVQSSEL